jgi:hypothetical protein
MSLIYIASHIRARRRWLVLAERNAQLSSADVLRARAGATWELIPRIEEQNAQDDENLAELADFLWREDPWGENRNRSGDPLFSAATGEVDAHVLIDFDDFLDGSPRTSSLDALRKPQLTMDHTLLAAVSEPPSPPNGCMSHNLPDPNYLSCVAEPDLNTALEKKAGAPPVTRPPALQDAPSADDVPLPLLVKIESPETLAHADFDEGSDILISSPLLPAFSAESQSEGTMPARPSEDLTPPRAELFASSLNDNNEDEDVLNDNDDTFHDALSRPSTPIPNLDHPTVRLSPSEPCGSTRKARTRPLLVDHGPQDPNALSRSPASTPHPLSFELTCEYDDPPLLPLPSHTTESPAQPPGTLYPLTGPTPPPSSSPLQPILPLSSIVTQRVRSGRPTHRPSWSMRASEAAALGIPARSTKDTSMGPPSPAFATKNMVLSSTDVAPVKPKGRRMVMPMDLALAMQLRPGIGVGADAAWMVRFLMAMFGWFAVLLSGGQGGQVDGKLIAER